MQGVPAPGNINGENPFLDASTGFDKSYDESAAGKGFVFPRADLRNWSFNLGLVYGGSPFFLGVFDGMIVYNTESGYSNNTGYNPTSSVAVTPGFYFFSNPTGFDDLQAGKTGLEAISNGKWVRLNDSNITTMPTTKPATPQAGDVYYEPNDKKFYYYNGTWVSVTGTPTVAPLLPKNGDTWYDISTPPGVLKIYDDTSGSGTWVTVGGVANGSITATKLQSGTVSTPLANASANGQVLTSDNNGGFKWSAAGLLPSGAGAPLGTAPEAGVSYYDKQNHDLYVSDGSIWKKVSSTGGAAGSIESHAGDPLTPSAGDVYYNTTNHNLYYYDGTIPSWVILSGVNSASGTPPTTGTHSTGETYYDTATNTLYVYESGTGWVPVGGVSGTPSVDALTKFSATDGTITNSTLTDNGTTVSTTGNLSVEGTTTINQW